METNLKISMSIADDLPRPGSYTTIGAQVGIITLVTINMVLFRRYNRKAEREEVVLEGVADFRYTL